MESTRDTPPLSTNNMVETLQLIDNEVIGNIDYLKRNLKKIIELRIRVHQKIPISDQDVAYLSDLLAKDFKKEKIGATEINEVFEDLKFWIQVWEKVHENNQFYLKNPDNIELAFPLLAFEMSTHDYNIKQTEYFENARREQLAKITSSMSLYTIADYRLSARSWFLSIRDKIKNSNAEFYDYLTKQSYFYFDELKYCYPKNQLGMFSAFTTELAIRLDYQKMSNKMISLYEDLEKLIKHMNAIIDLQTITSELQVEMKKNIENSESVISKMITTDKTITQLAPLGRIWMLSMLANTSRSLSEDNQLNLFLEKGILPSSTNAHPKHPVSSMQIIVKGEDKTKYLMKLLENYFSIYTNTFLPLENAIKELSNFLSLYDTLASKQQKDFKETWREIHRQLTHLRSHEKDFPIVSDIRKYWQSKDILDELYSLTKKSFPIFLQKMMGDLEQLQQIEQIINPTVVQNESEIEEREIEAPHDIKSEIDNKKHSKEKIDTGFDEYKKTQTEKITLYRAQVAEKKKEKEQKKEEERNLRNKKEEEQEEQPTLLKNITLENKILDLSDKQFALLKNIVATETDLKKTNETLSPIYYDDAVNFIENQLGGKVDNTGGTSHRCVQLESYFIRLNPTDKIAPPTTKESKKPSKKSIAKKKNPTSGTIFEKGGMVEHHGHAHNSGLLSPFNRELLRSIFHQVGLTYNVVTDLEKIRDQRKNQNLKNISPTHFQ